MVGGWGHQRGGGGLMTRGGIHQRHACVGGVGHQSGVVNAKGRDSSNVWVGGEEGGSSKGGGVERGGLHQKGCYPKGWGFTKRGWLIQRFIKRGGGC